MSPEAPKANRQSMIVCRIWLFGLSAFLTVKMIRHKNMEATYTRPSTVVRLNIGGAALWHSVPELDFVQTGKEADVWAIIAE